MKLNVYIEEGAANRTIPHSSRPGPLHKPGIGFLRFGWMAASIGFLWTHHVLAVSVTSLGTGQLPSGDVIVITQLTLNPGDKVPWHYHPGTGLRVVLSGTLTEDEGCGNPFIDHPAGSAFEEEPGKVHQIFNLGTDPVVVLRTDILPSCYEHQGTIFVTGPRCEGDSGRSHLEPIAPCTSDTGSREGAGKPAALLCVHAETSVSNGPLTAAPLKPAVASTAEQATARVALLQLAPAVGLGRCIP
jgi:quercetin dioxygenase-like cupin family protein